MELKLAVCRVEEHRDAVPAAGTLDHRMVGVGGAGGQWGQECVRGEDRVHVFAGRDVSVSWGWVMDSSLW